MSYKHNLTDMVTGTNNSMTSLVDAVNTGSGGVLMYGFIIVVFIVFFFSFSRKTQDMGKSFIQAAFITWMVSFILYLTGNLVGSVWVEDLIMLGWTVIVAISYGVMTFQRNMW